MEGEHVLGALPVQWRKGLLNIIPWTMAAISGRTTISWSL
jgi:hypothetical protein